MRSSKIVTTCSEIKDNIDASYEWIYIPPPPNWSTDRRYYKCAQDMALHTTELALHTTRPIYFDSLACLQIVFLTFECSLQLLVLPNVCLTITKILL